jgi:hypothetical protein
MQSLVRAIKRGNAVIAYNHLTMRNEPVWRKGTTKKVWSNAVRESVINARNIDEYSQKKK